MGILSEVDSWVEANQELILRTICELVQIRTENLPPGGNEKPGQEYLYRLADGFLPEHDLDLFEIDEVPGIREHPLFFPTIEGAQRIYRDRPNLVARLAGDGGGRSLVFTGHMDTVPSYGRSWKVFPDPFSGRIKDGRLYGRGALDMKAGTASGFLALKCLHDLGVRLKGDVYAESVVDEENGGVNGTLAARLRHPGIDFALLAEPSFLTVGIESIGGSDWKASVTEESPGGIGTDEELPNPIYKLSRLALALEKYDHRLGSMRPPETYDPGMHIRLLTYQLHSGGASYGESGGVPITGHIFFWQEMYSYWNEAEARRDLQDFLEKELGAQPEFRNGLPRLETVIRFLEGHRTDRSHPALSSLRRAYNQLGLEYEEKGIPFATDAFAFRKCSNTEVAIVGPEGANLHGMDEYVEIDSVLSLMKIMVLTALDFCSE
jgi:acetylornithine deacetylase